MVFLFIVLAFIIFSILLAFSKIKIEIENFRFSSNSKRHINKEYVIKIKLYIMGILRILNIEITKELLEKLKIKDKIKNIESKMIKDKNQFDKKILKAFKKLHIDINNLNLKIEIGTENSALTAILVPIIATLIILILQKNIKYFKVKPIYQNQNIINIAFSGIFEIKMIHIISIIYILNKKEGVNKNERPSDRRTYDYSYE